MSVIALPVSYKPVTIYKEVYKHISMQKTMPRVAVQNVVIIA